MKRKILIVEDHAAMREALVSWLAELYPDWIFRQADTAEAALQYCGEELMDLVLMDLGLRDMNGLEATKLIKQRCSKTRVVVLTIHEERQFKEAAFAVGADGFLPKRKIYTELMAVLDTMFNNVSRTRDEQVEEL